jgi:hypothetical protein
VKEDKNIFKKYQKSIAEAGHLWKNLWIAFVKLVDWHRFFLLPTPAGFW